MSSLADSSAIFSYHRDMIALHGNEHSKALGWIDAHSQSVRFEALSKIGDMDGHTILDAGCGYGDLCTYLKNYDHYYGVEQIPELLEEAGKRYGHLPHTTFLSGNFMYGQMPVGDYVLASGSLNYRSANPDFIFKAISRLYEHCRLGLGFNLLRHIPGEGLIQAYNPQTILSHCQRLSSKVVLLDDYDPDDFTVFLYR